ncbi:hypothetical protein HC251_16495 [Iamia sp. SCSIO 61187]|uniref:hypothetical protein n=1 Tax=Iamia sp. SCSIO 61187 TaxID=2722752 RepID=UPI001C638BF7|nr:hypothetical protein [Iamia sp. SCSIO 61187]QYG93871.1 hypothetical protein HC251_16495 [Iamia sp. SCSIO 61187]
MISVTQRCGRCGQQVPVDRECRSCTPSPPIVVRGMARLATAGLGAVALVAAVMNSST